MNSHVHKKNNTNKTTKKKKKDEKVVLKAPHPVHKNILTHHCGRVLITALSFKGLVSLPAAFLFTKSKEEIMFSAP